MCALGWRFRLQLGPLLSDICHPSQSARSVQASNPEQGIDAHQQLCKISATALEGLPRPTLPPRTPDLWTALVGGDHSLQGPLMQQWITLPRAGESS